MSLRNYDELDNSEKDFINKIVSATRSTMSEYAYSEKLTPNAFQVTCDIAKGVAEIVIPDFNAKTLDKEFAEYHGKCSVKTLLEEKEVKMAVLNKSELENAVNTMSSNEVELKNGDTKVLTMQDRMVFKAVLKSVLLTVNICARYNDVTDIQLRMTKDLAGDLTRTLLPDVEGYKNTYNQLESVFDKMSDKASIREKVEETQRHVIKYIMGYDIYE